MSPNIYLQHVKFRTVTQIVFFMLRVYLGSYQASMMELNVLYYLQQSHSYKPWRYYRKGDTNFSSLLFLTSPPPPPSSISSSPGASISVVSNHQNFLTFSLIILPHRGNIFKAIPSTCPKLLNLHQDHPSKKPDFLIKPLQKWNYTFSRGNSKLTEVWSCNHFYSIIWFR